MLSHTLRAWMPLAAMLLVCGGCDSFTEVDLPSSQLAAPDVFEDKATATAAMTEIYSSIRERGMLTGYPTGAPFLLSLYTDELEYYGTPTTGAANFYNNAILPSGSEISELLTASFSQVYAANAVIEGVAGSASMEQADRDQLTGEALFVRALLHLYLVNSFGAIPYVKTTDYEVNKSVLRMDETAVYAQIREDLTRAAQLLSDAYPTPERVRPNKSACMALMARVYLYQEDWQEAVQSASYVIGQTGVYTLGDAPETVFLKDSPSTIWQLMPAYEGSNTYEGSIFIFEQGPPPTAALTATLVNAFEAIDLRKAAWLREVTDGTDTWYHSYKYREGSNTGSSVEYSVILRMAELYLIRAEARIHTGDLDGAIADINVIRNFAGLPDTGGGSPDTLMDEVVRQRQLELFTEAGHRFFDLKRLGLLNSTLSPVKTGWNTYNSLLPLPESELLLNPNLAPQNEGY